MKRFGVIFLIMILLCLYAGAYAENQPESMEQGLDEIQTLLEMSDMSDSEGKSLEEMTDAFEGASMCEYLDSASGFTMQYPAVFHFDESEDGLNAVSADGRATLSVENMIHDGGLTREILIEAIRLEVPGYEPGNAETNGCLYVSRSMDQGKLIQTDLYYLTKRSLHRITLCYPSEEQVIYSSYIDYMINTMDTRDSELG